MKEAGEDESRIIVNLSEERKKRQKSNSEPKHPARATPEEEHQTPPDNVVHLDLKDTVLRIYGRLRELAHVAQRDTRTIELTSLSEHVVRFGDSAILLLTNPKIISDTVKNEQWEKIVSKIDTIAISTHNALSEDSLDSHKDLGPFVARRIARRAIVAMELLIEEFLKEEYRLRTSTKK